MYKFRIDISGIYKLDTGEHGSTLKYGYGLSDELAEFSPAPRRLQLYNSMGQQEPNGFDIRPQYRNFDRGQSEPAAFPLHVSTITLAIYILWNYDV